MARVLLTACIAVAFAGLARSQGIQASGGGGGLGSNGGALPPSQFQPIRTSEFGSQGGFNALNSNAFGNNANNGPLSTMGGLGGGLGGGMGGGMGGGLGGGMGGMGGGMGGMGMGGMGGGMGGMGGGMGGSMGGIGMGGMSGMPPGGGGDPSGGGGSGYGGAGGYGGGGDQSGGSYGGGDPSGGSYGGGQGGGGYGGGGGGGYGGDGGASIPNAGYGGYPGRGGFSGYWEPGVRPVPLALQGWGLFIPRPPVEITTPTTTATTVAATTRPASTAAATTVAATTVASTASTALQTSPTTISTTARPATTTAAMATYGYGNYPGSGSSYGSGSSSYYAGLTNVANKNLPEVFQVNGKKVMVMQVDDNDAAFGALFPSSSNSNKAADVTAVKSSMNPADDQAVDPPKTCIPTNTPTAKGVCIDDSLVQIACPNMIIAQGDSCRKNQFCCFVD